VARLLDAAPGLKYKATSSVAYGAGLRASEVFSLENGDIDSQRMVIRVRDAMGHEPKRPGAIPPWSPERATRRRPGSRPAGTKQCGHKS
jgi:integrase